MTVRFIRDDKPIAEHPAVRDVSLADMARAADLHLETPCGGRGICRRCTVLLHAGRYGIDGQAVEVSANAVRRARACGTTVESDEAVVELPADHSQNGRIEGDFVLPPYRALPSVCRTRLLIPPGSLEDLRADADRVAAALHEADPGSPLIVDPAGLAAVAAAIDREGGALDATWDRADGSRRLLDLAPAAGDDPPPVYALAIDIGTTTVAAVLLDPVRGLPLARAARFNAQLALAEDVAARISYCEDGPRLETMQRLIVRETVNPLIRELCAAVPCDPAAIGRVAAAGNTVMMHLLAGLSPAGLGVIPFRAVAHRHPLYSAASLGLAVHPQARLELVPSMFGYVGGDVTADLYAARFLDLEPPVLLVDIGTNGEMALWDGERLRVCATAAGPAFEGAGMVCGCRAADGAIERIRIGPGLQAQCRTIGGAPPVGLCGSAIIDFLAEGRAAGLLSETGRMDTEALRKAGVYHRHETDQGPVHACRLAKGPAGPVFVTERDVAELLKAKAAVRAGLETLLELAGIPPAKLTQFLLAGGFARYIDPGRALRIGLLPPIPADRIRAIGNGALAGACLALTDADAASGFDRIRAQAESVELNLTPMFEHHFIDALTLP